MAHEKLGAPNRMIPALKTLPYSLTFCLFPYMFNLLIIKDDLFCFYIKTEQQKVKHITEKGEYRRALSEVLKTSY
jgi:hypothetical protein